MKYNKYVYATNERTSLKQLLKKTFEAVNKNPKHWIKQVSFIGKVIDFIQLLVQSDRETYRSFLNLLAHMIGITAVYE